jgi:tetratricopeptide (TPR) repeat protein
VPSIDADSPEPIEPRPERSRIFISYRREDSAGHVLALLPHLRRHFGGDRIFKDTDSIEPGQDFVTTIEQELESCSVLLAIIGRDWLKISDPRLGRRRLDLPEDYLRQEVATALASKRILVIPVLVGRATMPTAEDLPPDLVSLARRNAVELSDMRWDSDLERLIAAIEKAAGEPARAAAVPKSPVQLPPPVKPVSRPSQGRELLEARRQRQIQQHLNTAREALAAEDFEAALTACDSALWLDPQHPEGLELSEQARTALDRQKVTALLAEARDKLSAGAVSAASELIDQALVVDASLDEALELRRELLRVKADKERERERSRLLGAAIDRMRASFEEGDFETTIEHAEDALALGDAPEALRLRIAAHEALAKRKRGGTTIEAARPALERSDQSAVVPDTEAAIAQAASVVAEDGAGRLELPGLQPVRRSREKGPLSKRPIALVGLGVSGVAVAAALVWSLGQSKQDSDAAASLPGPQAAITPNGGDTVGTQLPGVTARDNPIRTNPATDTVKRADLKKQTSRTRDLLSLARQHLANGRDADALTSVESALRADPRDAAVLAFLDGMLGTASQKAQNARDLAEKSGAPTDARDQYARAQQRLNLSVTQSQAGQKVLAIKSLWQSNQDYADAIAEAMRVADERRRVSAKAAPAPPPAPVPASVQPRESTPSVEETNRAKLAEAIREASRSCVDALKSRNLVRVIALYPGLASQQKENLARLRDLMNRSEAQFAVTGETISSPEFAGESATQDVRVRVTWKRFSGQRRNEVLHVRSSIATAASGVSCQIIGTAELR